MIRDEGLLARLEALAAAVVVDAEPAHDFSHVQRVVHNARILGRAAQAAGEPVDEVQLEIAALLHELVNLPKNHPNSSRSGDLCAEAAYSALRQEGVAREDAEANASAIRDHAFSKGATPTTLEGCILQDADRLDAIGAIGIARCFATTAAMKRPFYAPEDPFCTNRDPDDKQWGIDHFYKKLLKLQAGFHTEAARAIAARRSAFLQTYLDELASEILP